MKFKPYTREECNRFNGATGILGGVISICGKIIYNEARTDEEKETVLAFEKPFGLLKANLSIEDTEKIDWIYSAVKPLIFGDKPILTLDYILKTGDTWKNLLKPV
jgi:hypothetical protein